MVISTRYASPQQAVASYDYQDIADGTGVIIFYGYNHTYDSVTYALTTKSDVFSEYIQISNPDTDETYTFDSSVFNAPRICKGTAIINLPRYQTGAGTTVYYVTLSKVDGDTAAVTAITSTISVNRSTADTNTMCFSLPLTETTFKVGDSLRFTLRITTTGGAGTVYFACDPQARAGAQVTGSTKLQILMPFKIQE